MANVTLRAAKGSPLTHNEVDANFNNLNTDKLDTAGIALGSAASPTLKFTGDGNTGIYSPGADQVAISTGGTGRLFVDASGRVGVGTTTPSSLLSLGGSATAQKLLVYEDVANSRYGFGIQPGEMRTFAASSGVLTFGHVSTGDATTYSEKARIDTSGRVFIGTTDTTLFSNITTGEGCVLEADGALQLARSGDSCIYINRLASDGELVRFYQDGNQEGTINVSGSTISYNGAHLSRWSQLSGGATRKEILRGSVLSNIDEMCEWGDEENEQLNRMKVSDVEGDKNVSGVFQAWDDDDDTYVNDFYCAMTGDFIIRIGAGVTVERGDLLMSAGDGTAKPQDDDIIRSKTIAKVTSTNVSCTYDDGSYCVPCVLMAC